MDGVNEYARNEISTNKYGLLHRRVNSVRVLFPVEIFCVTTVTVT